MAQLTVYIDDETRRRIEIAAKRADTSVSQWVKEKLASALETQWPDGYFEWLASLEDVDLERPAEPRTDDDVAREPV